MTDRKANKKRTEYLWDEHKRLVVNLMGREVTMDDMKKFQKSFKDFKQILSRWYPPAERKENERV